MKAEDLKLGGQINHPQFDVVGDGQNCWDETHDRLHLSLDECLGDSLRGARRCSDDSDGDLELVDYFAQVCGRKHGYAIDCGEGMEGVHCVAAAVCDRNGIPVGAITVTAPSTRLPESAFSTTGEMVIEAARNAELSYCE